MKGLDKNEKISKELIFSDDYNLLSGWYHNYFCDIDGSELIFDPNNSKYFECPMCHKKYKDEKRKSAWVIKYRYSIFNRIQRYSELYLQNKNKLYLKFIIDALNFYCDNYDLFSIHDKDGNIFDSYINESNRCGKITAQGLNEASIFIQVVYCIDNVGQYIPKNLKNNLFNNLFLKVYELLKPQVDRIQNMRCYEVCSIGMMGIISNNKKMIDFALNSKYSFYEQLDKGVTKDYFWNEGSFHYHLYVLKPIIDFLYIAKKYNYKIKKRYYYITENMLLKIYNVSFNDCSLPSPNDGWPNLFLIKYIDLYEKANIIFDGYFTDIINNIRNNTNLSKSVHLIKTGFSNLKKNDLNVFIKYSDNDLSHAHPDKLNIEVKYKNEFFTHDLSTSGYGSDISKDFYKKTYSHNTVVINRQDQFLNCVSKVNGYSDDFIDVTVKNAYENCILRRRVKVNKNNIEDRFYVKCKENKYIDYFFHIDGKLISSLIFEEKIKIDTYPYLKNVRKVKCDNIIELNFKFKNFLVEIILELDKKELYICKSPDNPNIQDRTTILIRDYNKKSNLYSKFNFI